MKWDYHREYQCSYHKFKIKTTHRAQLVCSLQEPITVNCSLFYLWIPLQASWQVKWDGPKGRTLEGNIQINHSICNNVLAGVASPEEIIHLDILSTLDFLEVLRINWMKNVLPNSMEMKPELLLVLKQNFNQKSATIEHKCRKEHILIITEIQ